MKPIYTHLSGALALTLAIAACVPAPAPTPTPEPVATPAPRPAPAPAPPPPVVYDNWMDVPKSPGDWSYGATTTGSQALFGESASEARFALACSAGTRQVTLTRFGTATTMPSAIIIRTESVTRALAAQPSGDRASASASLAARDPLLDAIALTKGRFAVEAAGLPTLYLPAWGEVSHVIEDCR